MYWAREREVFHGVVLVRAVLVPVHRRIPPGLRWIEHSAVTFTCIVICRAGVELPELWRMERGCSLAHPGGRCRRFRNTHWEPPDLCWSSLREIAINDLACCRSWGVVILKLPESPGTTRTCTPNRCTK